MKQSIIFIILSVLLLPVLVNAQIYYAGKLPAKATSPAGNTLENNVLRLKVEGGKQISRIVFADKLSVATAKFENDHLFRLKLKDGKQLTDREFYVVKQSMATLPAKPGAVRGIDRLPGKQLVYVITDASERIRITWSMTLRDNCNFVQHLFHMEDPGELIADLTLVDVPAGNQPELSGKVDGSPVLAGSMFFALEHPMAQQTTTAEGVTCNLAASAALRNGNGFDASVAWGITPAGQLRRGFLYYLELVRAVPYHVFPHYNSWYDVGYDGREITEANALDRIRMFGDSLVAKRKARIRAFLWDSGWDDYNRLWYFSSHLPNGFKKMDELAKKYRAGMAVWVSPWGGYDAEKISRLASIKRLNLPFTPNDNGLSLADKNYFNYFKKLTEGFVKNQGVIAFKFDGVGAGNGVGGAEKYAKDVESFLRVITALRQIKPDLYFNLTVGTWPSPYWLNYGDAIWRAGGDMDVQGAGTKRQQWINYRDAEVYKNVVQRSRLYPLNALMYHGVVVNDQSGVGASFKNDDEGVAEDIWEFFGNGTAMQELYINPHLMSSRGWDELARALRWSEQHQEVLADVHWIGGDPGKEEIYGFAAWDAKSGVITWRNPSAHAQKITINLKDVMEMPADTKAAYDVLNVVKQQSAGTMRTGENITLELQPFEVKILELNSRRK